MHQGVHYFRALLSLFILVASQLNRF